MEFLNPRKQKRGKRRQCKRERTDKREEEKNKAMERNRKRGKGGLSYQRERGWIKGRNLGGGVKCSERNGEIGGDIRAKGAKAGLEQVKRRIL